ncbi:hypothetical protein MMC18_008168 [Xylographa bjoerkii]|nr:hypothetical protein [Xylographa bjoerkii]
MAEESQPTAANLQTTASTNPSSEPHTSSTPEGVTTEAAATSTNASTSTVPAKATGTQTPIQDNEPRGRVPSEDLNINIEDFDWADLEHRYHADMQTCANTETALFEDFAQAIRLFESWASVTTTHENDRSYKRYFTRF